MKQLEPSSFVDAPVATTLYTNGEFVVGQSASDWFAWRPGEPSLQWRHERQASLTGNNVSAVGETQVTSMLDQGPARETTYESRDLRTGELLWTMRSDLRAGRQGLYHHGDQILLRGSSEQGYFLARHRAEDGTELSRVEAPAGEVVVVLGQTVFFGSAKGLYVLRDAGAERVQRLAVGWPVAVGKHLVVPMAAIAGATKLFVRWFDESGTELAHTIHPCDGASGLPAVLDSTTVAVATKSEGGVAVLRSGDLVWETQAPGWRTEMIAAGGDGLVAMRSQRQKAPSLIGYTDDGATYTITATQPGHPWWLAGCTRGVVVSYRSGLVLLA